MTDKTNSERAAPGVPLIAPLDHCRPYGILYDLPPLVFTAAQLREALEFFGGDEGDADDPVRVSIALRDEGPDVDGEPCPRGLYVWMTDYPEEGSLPLTGKPLAAAPQAPAEASWGAAKALIQRHDSIEDALRVFGDDPTDDNGTGVVIAVLEAVAPAAPQAPTVMVDMCPPATARDRWMYEQGRLAERDPRTHAIERAAAPQVPTLLNGLTEAETEQTASVAGLVAPQVPLTTDEQAALTQALRRSVEIIDAAPQVPEAVPLELDPDEILSIADAQADESFEDGRRLIDRGGLIQFAKDVLRRATPQPAERVPLTDGERAELEHLRALVNTPELHDFSRSAGGAAVRWSNLLGSNERNNE